MELTHGSWTRIESDFRHRAAELARLMVAQHQEIDVADTIHRMTTLADSASSAHEFEAQWKKSIGPSNGLDLAEEFAEESRRHTTPEALISEAMRYTDLELEQGRIIFKSADEGDEYLDKIADQLDSFSLVIDHAFYAIYVAWRPDTRIIVPDNRIELLRALVVDESFVRIVSPRQFEELIAFVYETLGCRVELTQESRDFGADVLAWQSGPFASESLIAVQVKRYAPHRRVGLKDIFELHGAVTHYHADLGHVVTTSDFTGPARRFASDARHHLVNKAALEAEIARLFGR